MRRSLRVGDVAPATTQWGNLLTSIRNTCPSCHTFVARGSNSCTRCGATFAFITKTIAEVTSYASV
jgi:predicted amidophosphoribosyltransferase